MRNWACGSRVVCGSEWSGVRVVRGWGRACRIGGGMRGCDVCGVRVVQNLRVQTALADAGDLGAVGWWLRCVALWLRGGS